MKIAVPVTHDNQVDEHFGHCAYYSVFTIDEQKKIKEIKMIEATSGCGCKSNIASELSALGVTIMLAGGIGAGAIDVLNRNGISVIRGCTGQPETLVRQYLDNQIKDSGISCSEHQEHHGHGH